MKNSKIKSSKKNNTQEKLDYEIVIVGTDINAYYMGRNFNEAYGKKVHWIGKVGMPATSLSNLGDVYLEPHLWEKDVFVNTLVNYAKKLNTDKIILIGTNDFYVRNIIENKKELEKYYIFSTLSEELFNTLALKDVFYTKYANYGIDIPKTYIYNCGDGKNIDKAALDSLLYPVIVKPGHNVNYFKHEFLGQAKVYKLNDATEVENIVSKIKEAGYTDNLIIQEFIPGDDSMLFDIVFYADHTSNVQFMTFAQIGLQEHTPTGIGNCTVLVNGYNEFGKTEKIASQIKNFIQKIHYVGPGEVDIKYDIRDGKFKVLEINPRQGRSSYYSTAVGFNIAKYIVDDIVYNKKHKFMLAKSEVALSFVPMYVVKKYVENVKLKEKVIELKKKNKLINPLVYNMDMNFKRKEWLFKRDLNYCKKYRVNKW